MQLFKFVCVIFNTFFGIDTNNRVQFHSTTWTRYILFSTKRQLNSCQRDVQYLSTLGRGHRDNRNAMNF